MRFHLIIWRFDEGVNWKIRNKIDDEFIEIEMIRTGNLRVIRKSILDKPWITQIPAIGKDEFMKEVKNER